MDLATYLDQQLRAAGIPIIGVRIASQTDRRFWLVQFDATATQAQQDQAAALLASVVTDPATLSDADVSARLDDKALKALVIWLAGKFGITAAAARNQIVTIYKSL